MAAKLRHRNIDDFGPLSIQGIVDKIKEDPLISPKGKKAIPFWSSITKTELDAITGDSELCAKLQWHIHVDPFFYVVRTEVYSQQVFANTKGAITLPVSSLKLGTFVRM